jgi:hypothetical protein
MNKDLASIHFMKRPIAVLQDPTPKFVGMFLGIDFLGKSMDGISGGRPRDHRARDKMRIFRRDFLTARFVRDEDGARLVSAACQPPLGALDAAKFIAALVMIHDADSVDRLDRYPIERAMMSILLTREMAEDGKAYDKKDQGENSNKLMNRRHDFKPKPVPGTSSLMKPNNSKRRSS